MWKAVTRKLEETNVKHRDAYFAMLWIAFFVLADVMILYYFLPAKY